MASPSSPSENPANRCKSSTSATKFSPTRDFFASIVVFLVALPLCMGVAIASGAPVSAGLITGIVGGILVGSIAGSPLQVSGPAAGLTVIVLGVIQSHGLETLGLAVLTAGVLQIAAGGLGFGRYFRAVSPAVVEGMLTGIGILILAGQFHVMVDDSPRKHGWENLLAIPESLASGLPMPEINDAGIRRSQAELLRAIGKLHAEQRQIVKQAESAISHDSGPTTNHFKAAELTLLQRRQSLQSEKLAALEREADLVAKASGPEQEKVLHARWLAAVAAVTDARKHLLEGTAAGTEATLQEAQANLNEYRKSLLHHDWAGKLGVVTICILVLWLFLPQAIARLIPGPLAALGAATALAFAFSLPVVYVQAPENLVSDLRFPTLALVQQTDWRIVIGLGVVIALVASAETLLCASAVDQMHHGPRTQYDRELMAQGIGNFICGLCGALPMTGVIVRSAANVQAGATSRMSSILHGVWLLVFVAFFTQFLQLIPTAALAALLVFTGFRLINVKALRALWKADRMEAVIFLATVTVIVADDLLHGVIVGLSLAAARLLWQFSHLETQLELDSINHCAVLRLRGAATFLRLPQLAQVLEQVPPATDLHVKLEELDFIDHACLETLVHWEKRHESTGGTLAMDWEALTAKFGARKSNRNGISSAVAKS